MVDFASCLSEYSVKVSDNASCSSNSNSSCIISPNSTPSIQNSVTCSYKVTLTNKEQMLVSIQWCKNSLSQCLNLTFDSSNTFKINTNSKLFRKLKGSKSVEFLNRKIEIFWDFSSARYRTGPEPIDGFYLIITFDSQIGLILGDMAREDVTKKAINGTKFSLISRQEHFSGNNTLYSTKARFCETGNFHDVSIRLSGEKDGFKYPILSVLIDKKVVIRVKRLQWNFRGNQTIFLDNLLVDFMWDVNDWFSDVGLGNGVFMFRNRSGLDSRLWIEEKKDEVHEFSLMIYGCKNLGS